MVEFGSEDTQEWREALDAYQERLEGLGNEKLGELDEFYRLELPKVVAKRRPEAYITQDELVKVMDWKLSRGKWRARLQSFVAALSDDEVQEASQKAFAALPNLKEAVSQLSVLKGIGPATASAVLAAHAPAVAPFMSDEAMVAALGNAKDYTLKSYLVFAEKLRNKAEELSNLGEDMESFTPSDIERALWSTAAASMPKKTPKSTKAGKGKAAAASAATKGVKRKR
ncbi:hypothetical protein M758_2G116100 [Ceratodon purpureus]|nr:hypothetical protein M758_2G116100 [Ceratodon purpureus]